MTGFIPLPAHPRRDEYRSLGARLLALPVDIDFHSDTKLEDCWYWRAAHEQKELPRIESGSPDKDTLEYLSVQHQKTEWLERSQRKHPSVDTFVWIDYGIFHMPGVMEQHVLDFLAAVERHKPTAIESPGCLPTSSSIDIKTPCWRFCGAVLVCPAPLVAPFNAAVKQVATSCMEASGRATWEVNTWALVEQQRAVPIRQYHAATHNQCLFTAYHSKDSARPTIKLHMMVKDEARRIRETLKSVRPWIDSWLILDTGSTDGTQDIIRETLQGTPGELHERPIVTYADTGIIDYAATRNLGLDLAGTDSEFLLLLNGDDILHEGEALKDFRWNGDGFHMEVRGSGGGPSFVYPRLVRPSAGWRYQMPTHEILCGTNPVAGQVPGTWIEKCDDPEEVRLARWEKDQIVLERWLKDHLGDHRALFYLGQTYECLSCFGDTGTRATRLRAAIDRYSKRGELGGWADEAYEAFIRAANLLERLGQPWSEVQDMLLKAYAGAPHRAEPLALLAQHWIDTPAVSFLFSRRAAETPVPPPGALNPDRHLYDVVIPDLVSRSAYYVNEKDIGRANAKKAVEACPDDNCLRRNYHFYARPLKPLQVHDLSKGWELEPGWTCSTPSVCVVGNELVAIIRTVNYKIKDDGSYDYDGTIRTRNYLARIDGRHTREIQDLTGLPRSEFPVHGFEDCRLFPWKDGFGAVCTVRDTTEEGRCEQALLQLDAAGDVREMTLLRGVWSDQDQKNWKPVIDGSQLRWIYSTDPLCVFEHGMFPSQVQHAGRLLGSSQAVKTSEGWLWVDHEVSHNGSGRERIYVHRFVLADHILTKVVKKSEPFYFEQLGVEFCAGLALLHDSLFVSYSVRDASSKLATIPLDAAMKLLGGCSGRKR